MKESFKMKRIKRIAAVILAVAVTAAVSTAVSAKDLSVGDTVVFGVYEQDNDLSNGKEKIEWRVLDIKNGKALLLSEKALDCKPFDNSWKDVTVTWEDCWLRSWLNADFLNTAFSRAEQEAVPTVTVPAGTSPYSDIDPGNDTQDKVFVLSIEEVQQYFDLQNNVSKLCYLTEYAKAQGAFTNESEESLPIGSCHWWLRSPGSPTRVRSVAFIHAFGYLEGRGEEANYDGTCVRPALWIDLDVFRSKTQTPDEEGQSIRNMKDGYPLGDVNTDEKIDSRDARLALRAAAKTQTLSEWQALLADVNEDGRVRSDDARAILRIAAKLAPIPDKTVPEPGPVRKNATLAVLDARYVPQISDVVRFTASDSEYAAHAVIFTDVPVRDLRVIRFSSPVWGSDAFGSEELFRLDEFVPERPLALTFELGEIFPTTGISYTDADGTTQLFELTYSGEDGSLQLIWLSQAL